MSHRILVVEDDFEIRATLVEYLELRGYRVDSIHSGTGARSLLEQNRYDLMVLDLGLPGMDGLALCRWLREEQRSPMPVIMLTARDQLDDKLAGFTAGTDDYLVKPFALSELLVRMEALLRRSAGQFDSVLRVGPLVLDPERGCAERDGVPLRLNPKCFRLLEVLMRKAPALVSAEELADALWGEDQPDSEAIKTHIYRLRAAIDKPFGQPLLETVHGRGYRLKEV